MIENWVAFPMALFLWGFAWFSEWLDDVVARFRELKRGK
jgi:hypothetical protein